MSFRPYFVYFSKAFDNVDYKKQWKILKEMGIPDHLTCLLRNLNACQEAMVRVLEWNNWLAQNWERSSNNSYLASMQSTRNAGPDESQAGIKIAWRNINNLRYAGDTILMAESEEEPKSLLMRVKEESEKAGLELNIKKTKIMTSGPITSWQIEGGKWKQWQILFSWAPKMTAYSDWSHKIKRHLLLGRKAMTNLDSILKSGDNTLPTKRV